MARCTSAKLGEVYRRMGAVSVAGVIGRFQDRGLSYRTIDALIKSGLDFPEMLLNKTDAEIFMLPGIGKVSRDEIMRYKEKFEKQ